MKVIDPGHVYDLDMLDGNMTTRLTFVKREGDGYPGNVGSHPGTNMQEVIRALLDRLIYVHRQIPDYANMIAIQCLRTALWALEMRAAKRHGRKLKALPFEIEKIPTCSTCGHIECEKHKKV